MASAAVSMSSSLTPVRRFGCSNRTDVAQREVVRRKRRGFVASRSAPSASSPSSFAVLCVGRAKTNEYKCEELISRREANAQVLREGIVAAFTLPLLPHMWRANVAEASTSNQYVIEDDAGAALKTTDVISIPAIRKERFAPALVELAIPSPLWQTSSARIKQNKTLLYTDTYGPNNKYTFRLPRFSNSVDSRTCVEDVSVSVQTAPRNEESIQDVGDISDIDVRAFDIPVDDIESADIMYVKQVTSNNDSKQVYYQWDLAIPDSNCERSICGYSEVVLVSATISGGGLYVLSMRANKDQWLSEESNIKKLRQSFNVQETTSSSLDVSQRIYGQ